MAPRRLHRFLIHCSATEKKDLERSVPVVIIGGGTVGKCLSVMLSRLGVDTLLVEQQSRTKGENGKEPPHSHPRAHVLHTRTMEILRELGLEQNVHHRAPPLSQWRHFRYGESILGEEFGAVDFYKGHTAKWLRAASPATLSHLSQPILDEILGEVIDDESRFPGEIRRLEGYRGTRFEFINEEDGEEKQDQCLDDDGALSCGREGLQPAPAASAVSASKVGIRGGRKRVAVTLTPSSSSSSSSKLTTSETTTISCDFLVAADGANSAFRTQLGINLEGSTALQHFVSVHFTCRDLWNRINELQRPGMLHFVFNRNVVGFPYYPPHQSAEEMTNLQTCEKMVRDCIGVEDDGSGRGGRVPQDESNLTDDIVVHSADAWCMNALVAESFSDKEGRVFLVGDSAHQFPPSGVVFHMNPYIQMQDAF
eukprot:jgi/Bigna1/126708/aug1.3_g1416